jgi:hypothetical protein
MMKHFWLIPFLALIFLSYGCTEEGCTDPKANNFSYEANKDDGSCDYGGCTDLSAINFEKDALYDNGSCKYNGDVYFVTSLIPPTPDAYFVSVKINDQYIGSLSQNCNIPNPNCSTTCERVNFLDQSEGSYYVQYWEIIQRSSTEYDTIFESGYQSINVNAGDCSVYWIK